MLHPRANQLPNARHRPSSRLVAFRATEVSDLMVVDSDVVGVEEHIEDQFGTKLRFDLPSPKLANPRRGSTDKVVSSSRRSTPTS